MEIVINIFRIQAPQLFYRVYVVLSMNSLHFFQKKKTLGIPLRWKLHHYLAILSGLDRKRELLDLRRHFQRRNRADRLGNVSRSWGNLAAMGLPILSGTGEPVFGQQLA